MPKYFKAPGALSQTPLGGFAVPLSPKQVLFCANYKCLLRTLPLKSLRPSNGPVKLQKLQIFKNETSMMYIKWDKER